MKIKENQSDYFSWIIKRYNKLYKRKVIFSFSAVIILSIYSIMLIHYGMGLQRNQLASTLQQIIYDGTKAKLNIISNYFKGLISNPDNFTVDIKFLDLQKLNYIRQNALQRGQIIDKDKKLEVEAKINLKGKSYKVKLSPTGQNLDMIGDPSKYAYKVTVKGEDTIYGMKEFKLIPPKSRHHIVEWIGHKIEKKEGLITLRYDFIELTLNGDSKGIYAIEEHFSKELLENNRSREGLLLYFTENNKIGLYNKQKIITSNTLKNQLELLNTKWQAYQTGELPSSKMFDLKKYAKFFAIIDLLDGEHAAGIYNLKMYFNPVTNLIEPIAREYNSLRYSDGPPNSPLMIESINPSIPLKNYPLVGLFKNDQFIKLYIDNLQRMSKSEYLDKFFIEIDKEYNKKLDYIHKYEPYYTFPKQYMYLRQTYIINKLKEKINLNAYYNLDVENSLHVAIRNQSKLPVELLEVTSTKEKLYECNNQILFAGETLNFVIDHLKNTDGIGYRLKYRLIGLHDLVHESIIIPKSFKTGSILPKLIAIADQNISDKSYLSIDENKKTITFKSSKLIISQNLVIPYGYKVIGYSGLNIDLINNASILSYSPVELIGSSDKPILVYSTDNTGQGLTIMQTTNVSLIKNVVFRNMKTPKHFGWGLTGAVTIYESDIQIENSIFKDNHSEDCLNIIRSTFNLTGCLFEDIYADAIDIDFSMGTINACTFTRCGNDAIDISGSDLHINNINIDNAADKGISAGEKSSLKGTFINIRNSEIAITSKDMSNIELIDVTISDTKVGFTAFQKKPEYGPGKIDIRNLTIKNIEVPYLVEKGSIMYIDGKHVATTEGKIENILYGYKYGKSSN